MDAELAEAIEATAESAPVSLDEPLPEEQPLEEAPPSEEPLPEEATPAEEPVAEELSEEPVAAEAVAEPVEEEAPPPFQASLVVEKGPAQGTAFMLAHLENRVGGSGAQIELGEDGSAALVDLGAGPSGVFVRVRAKGQHDLQGGDIVMLGDQLLRVEVG